MKTGLESLDTGAPKITYRGNEGPQAPMQMAMADPMLVEQYQQYVFEMEEQGLQPMSFEEFVAQARAGMAGGGIMGSNAGSMLVAPTADGSRPGYYGPDMAEASTSDFGKDTYSAGDIDRGGREGISDADAARVLAARSDLQAGVDAAAAAKEAERLAAQKEAERVQAILDSYKDKTPEAYASTKFGKAIKPYDFGKRPYTPLGIIPTAVHIAKKFKTNLDDKRIRKELGLSSVDEIEMDMPYTPFFKSRIKLEPDRDGPPPIIIPPITPVTNTEIVDPEDLGTEFISQFTRNELTDADKERISNIGGKSIFLADGGRANYAGGGIAGLRQGYFLGKLVKKIGRGIKKVVKSPIGKAALLLGGGYLMNKGTFGGVGEGFFSNMFSSDLAKSIKNKLLMEKIEGKYTDNFDPFKIGILGASALGGLYAKKQQDDEPSLDEYLGSASRGPGMDPRAIREYIAMNKGNISPIDYAFLNPNYYQTAADGGRIGYDMGGIAGARAAALNQLYGINDEEEFSQGGSAGLPPITQGVEGQASQSFSDDETPMPTQPDQMPKPMPNPMMMAGRMSPMMMAQEGGLMASAILGDESDDISMELYGKPVKDLSPGQLEDLREYLDSLSKDFVSAPSLMARPRVMAQEGGLMDMGGMEKDYRNEGGFVPIGGQERADDVPARLSKNEFVFTADAVRNAGGGDIDKGAEVMENMMENLEKGGKVSEESQGLKGARDMFATAQRLEGVL
jgi:hypothetical protein